MVLDKNDDVPDANQNEESKSQLEDTALSIDRGSIHRYCAAIETAVQTDQFSECAMLLNELIGQIGRFYKGEAKLQSIEIVQQNKQTLAQAQRLLYRCQDPLLASNQHERGKLRDDVRNGLVLLLSDVLDCEHQFV